MARRSSMDLLNEGKTETLPLTRRSVVTGLGAGMLGPSAARGQSAAKPWSSEYWAKKGAVSLYMFRKRMRAPRTGETPLPVLFLVHGSSNSSRSSFDLAAPGHGEYSM